MLEFYKHRIEEVSIDIAILSKKLGKLSIIRLLFFVSGFVLLFVLSKLSIYTSVAVFFVFFMMFLLVVLRFNKLEKEKEKKANLLIILNNELDTSDNLGNLFGNGIEFENYFHPFTSDLDVFGKFSIFNKINRTVTYEGKETLAKWLKGDETDVDTIVSKQSAIKYLSGNKDLREEFLLCFFLSNNLSAENTGYSKMD